MSTHQPRFLASSPFNDRRVPPPPPHQFDVGQRVTHDRHGLGRVIRVEDEVAAIVDFGDRRVRVTLASGRLHSL